MTVRDICEYIAFIDYDEYHRLLNTCYGMWCQIGFKKVAAQSRVIRHKMYTIAFDMIMRGEYYG